MNLEQWLGRHGETAQYVVFVAMLVLMGALEGSRATGRAVAKRWPRWRTNFALTAINVVTLGALPTSFIAAARFSEREGFGVMHAAALPLWATLSLGLLARGFVSWLTHLLMHKVPLLWRVHRVHHTDTELDVSTTVRFHPLEFPIGLVFGLPFVFALGIPAWVLLVYELLDVGVTVFSHANVALPLWLDRWLRYVFVTPNSHRVHHSTEPQSTDSNFSAVFPVWDVIFGTFRAGAEGDNEPLGLREVRDARALSLGWLLGVPFRADLARGVELGAAAPTPRVRAE